MITRIRRCLTALAGPAAPWPPSPPPRPLPLPHLPSCPCRPAALNRPTRQSIWVTGGMPGWQITLIAAVALAAAVIVVLLGRARAARRTIHPAT